MFMIIFGIDFQAHYSCLNSQTQNVIIVQRIQATEKRLDIVILPLCDIRRSQC